MLIDLTESERAAVETAVTHYLERQYSNGDSDTDAESALVKLERQYDHEPLLPSPGLVSDSLPANECGECGEIHDPERTAP